MSQDTLSDVLRTVRLRSALFFDLSCAGKWLATAPGSGDIAAMVMPEVDQVIDFHVVTSGECWIAIQGEQPLRLARGDIVILPQGDPHVVSSAPGMRAESNVDWQREMKLHNRPFRVRAGDGAIAGPQSCGGEPGKDFDGRHLAGVRFHRLRQAALQSAAGDPAAPAALAGDGRQRLGRAVRATCGRGIRRARPGSEALLERMSEMMFVDAIRRHIDGMPSSRPAGWRACAIASSAARWR
jgi:hypothetical protein